MKKRIVQTVAVAACAALAAASIAQQLAGAGATFPYPIYSQWFDAFHGANPGITLNYQSIGSGGGVLQLKNKTVDFGATDAPLTDEEEKLLPGPVVHLPTVGVAVALTYNIPGVGGGLKLSGNAIADLFLGKITRWNDPRIAVDNPGIKLPSTPVSIAHRSDGSGLNFVFTQYLASISPEWKERAGAGKTVPWPVGLGGKGCEGIAAIVRQTPGSIGYIELAYALENRVPYASVENSSGRFVAPSVAGVAAAAAARATELKKDVRALIVDAPGPRAYPICGLTYLLAYRNQPDAARGKALIRFLRWTMTPAAQAMAAPLEYAPLPAPLVEINSRTLDALVSAEQAAGK